MNTYNNEKGGGSDDRASSRVPATTGERALEKDLANDILRIVPIGPSAETAFYELAVKKRKGQLDEHYAQFIVVIGKELVSAIAGYDFESATADSIGDEEVLIYRGYFRFNFDCTLLSQGVKWVLEKGVGEKVPSRNVDILLAVSGSRYRKHLASAHTFLKIKPESGAWILHAGEGYYFKELDPVAQASNGLDRFSQCHHKPVILNNEFIKHGSM